MAIAVARYIHNKLRLLFPFFGDSKKAIQSSTMLGAHHYCSRKVQKAYRLLIKPGTHRTDCAVLEGETRALGSIPGRSKLISSILAPATFTYLLDTFSFSSEVSACPNSSNKLGLLYLLWGFLNNVCYWLTKKRPSLSVC